MDDFLAFLNTTDLDTLTRIPGITRPLAGNLIAARPFDSLEDCLKVRGMGKHLLARIQTTFDEAQTKPPENRAMVTVPEQAQEQSIEKGQPQEQVPPAPKGPSFWSRLGQAFIVFVRALFRLILTLLVVGGILAAFYFGLPFLNERLIAPVERNTARTNELAAEIAALQTELAALREETSTLQTEFSGLNDKVDALEIGIESHTATLKKLQDMQATLEEQMRAGDEQLAQALREQLLLTRAVEVLARARLYLSQSNFGLARNDVLAARGLLVEVQASAPAYQLSALDQVITRLDLALGNLPDFPVIAASDVDIAWQVLLNGLPGSAAEALPTATLEPTPTSTPTPAAQATASATPVP